MNKGPQPAHSEMPQLCPPVPQLTCLPSTLQSTPTLSPSTPLYSQFPWCLQPCLLFHPVGSMGCVPQISSDDTDVKLFFWEKRKEGLVICRLLGLRWSREDVGVG